MNYCAWQVCSLVDIVPVSEQPCGSKHQDKTEYTWSRSTAGVSPKANPGQHDDMFCLAATYPGSPSSRPKSVILYLYALGPVDVVCILRALPGPQKYVK